MLRTQPPGEDATSGARARPVAFSSPGTPPGEDGIVRAEEDGPADLENAAQSVALESVGADDQALADERLPDFLALVRSAEDQALLYAEQTNRKAWSASLRAFHNEHHVGSKYTRPEWRGRSRLFVPKTRAAVRKDQASVAASLFNNIDAISCVPGNDGDPRQRAAAAVMQELVNYRTDRSSGHAAIPWFSVAMGARQDALLTGICVSKQVWKVDYRKDGEEQSDELEADENGVHRPKMRDVYTVEIDRPDVILFPPENVIVAPSADWTNPAQTAPYLILKYPMTVDEIRRKQKAPVNPWHDVPVAALRSFAQTGKFDMEAIRRAREMGVDRLDETQTGNDFAIIWVSEVFMRVAGDDWCFYSLGHHLYLTDPRPVREVYPEQYGERPLALGYGSFESHRIFPMSPVESWQMLQLETNELRNLMLDGIKQNVMPITKIRRGRQIDLDQVRRRSAGSAILVQEADDVTWETPPQIPESAVMMGRELDLELDDLAGQQNYGSVETNNALGKTLGGLKLAAGAANAVQEFDIRVWIETWATPVLAQIVRLEQYYESDPIVLGLAGERAKLFQKHGISKIDDKLLEEEVVVRVSIGLGAGDPQQRLAKFQSAANIVAPILQNSPEFQSGRREINAEAIIEEVFGAAGYKDGGARFFKENDQPRANPMADLNTKKLESEIAKNERMGKASMMTGLAAVARIALGKRELEASVVDNLLDHQREATRMGADHGHRASDQHLAALDHGHRHGLALANHRRQLAQDVAQQAAQQTPDGGDPGMDGSQAPPAPPSARASGTSPQGSSPGSPPPPSQPQLPPGSSIEFVRDPRSGRITGARIAAAPGASQEAAPPPPPDPTEERLARLEAIAERLAKPRARRVVRDANNRIVRVEDEAAA